MTTKNTKEIIETIKGMKREDKFTVDEVFIFQQNYLSLKNAMFNEALDQVITLLESQEEPEEKKKK